MSEKRIELVDMPNSYFTRCLVKPKNNYEYGMLMLTKNNQLQFTSRETNTVRLLNDEEISRCYTRNGKPFNRSKLLSKTTLAVKLKIPGESEPFESFFIVVSMQGEVTLNGEILQPGSVVLFDSDVPRIYTDYAEFAADVEITEEPDFEKTKTDLKSGVRSNSIVNGSHRVAHGNSGFGGGKTSFDSDDFEDFEGSSLNGSFDSNEDSDGWVMDKDALYKNAKFIITKQLFKENKNGSLIFVGYYLQDLNGGDDKKLTEAEAVALAKNYKIKNAKAVSKGGKNYLQGINCSLDNLEQAFWEE